VSRLILINAAQMEKILLSIGFVNKRQKGSHVFYRHPDGRTTTVPHHGNRMLARPLIRKILHDINIGVDEYEQLI